MPRGTALPSWLALAWALALLFGLVTVTACRPEAATPPASGARSAARAPTPPRSSRKSAPPPADLDLQAMLSPVPEYEGTGRNLFAYGPVRRAEAATPAPPPVPPPLDTSPSRPAPAPRPPRPAPTRIDVKYAGFLEKTRPDGAKAKYAIFLDGNEILAGAEGETVGNRFTVVEIGLESVTVSARGSNATQRIPLQAN